MRRRDFTALLSAAAVWPLAARAQSSLPVVGFLDSGTPDGMEGNLAGFHKGLGERGFAEGKNVTIDYRWAAHRVDQLPVLAAELVRRPVSAIAATRSPAPALAAKAATSTIPVVFQTGGDPVQDGLVTSLNRPSANLTGATRMTTDVIPKRFGLIAELKPKTAEIAALINPIGPQASGQRQELETAAHARGLTLHFSKPKPSLNWSPLSPPSRKARPTRSLW
jgi:putative ABC transport system substrate-binding protein